MPGLGVLSGNFTTLFDMDPESRSPTRRATGEPGASAGLSWTAGDGYDGYDGGAVDGIRRLRGFRAPTAGESGPGDATPPVAPPPPAAPSPPGRRWAAAAAGVLVVAIVIIAVLAFRLGTQSAPSADRPPATAAPTATTTPTTLAVTDVYRQVVPSVVLITTSKGSLGAGVIVTDTGVIMTADHVISDGGAITVLFSDGTKASATVAAADPATDIATLTPGGLPEVVVAATLGGGVDVGADVVAIGNPLGLQDSTTAGVVSGLDRQTKTDAGRLSGLIQFDAAVNPGSSGGPLLNSQGLVVGIVVSIADPGNDDAFAGIGFAVPIAAALGGGSGSGPGAGPQL